MEIWCLLHNKSECFYFIKEKYVDDFAIWYIWFSTIMYQLDANSAQLYAASEVY